MNEKLIPVNTNVVVEFYDNNPYRKMEKTQSGLIISYEGVKNYKSQDSGEIEESEEIIACAKVIAVGPKCENVQEGDNIFVYKTFARPIPYMMRGYYCIAEQNIYCIIRKE